MDSTKINIHQLTRQILREAAMNPLSLYELQKSIQKRILKLSKEHYLNQHGSEYSGNSWEFYIPFTIKNNSCPQAGNLNAKQLQDLQKLHKQNYLSDIMTRIISNYDWVGDWKVTNDGQWLAITDRELGTFYNKEKKELPISKYGEVELQNFHAIIAERDKDLTVIKNEIKKASEVYEERFCNFLGNRLK